MSLWHAISFREPLWLLLALQPLLLLLLSLILKRRNQYSSCDQQLRPWVIARPPKRQLDAYARKLLFITGWIFLAIAMAGPRQATSIADQQYSVQRELLVLLDVSPSMNARDIQPSRLERARLELLDLVNRMQATRMGIIVYGARPHQLSPPTHDKTVLRHYINSIRTDQLPTLGSRLDLAMSYAGEMLTQKSSIPRALLIVSDGEHQPANSIPVETTATRLSQAGIHIYALGIGTSYGAPVMGTDQNWLTDKGEVVNSRLNTELLQKLARVGHGQYSELHDSNLDWQQLYDKGIGQLSPVSHGTTTEQLSWQEYYHNFLIAGFICLLLSLWQTRAAHATATVLLVFLLSYPSQEAIAEDASYSRAWQLLKDKNYQAAQQMFHRLPGYAARFGEGNAAYQLQQYNKAAGQYVQAVLEASNDKQRGHALFNLANSFYQLNDYFKATQLYEDVLRYLPSHKAAETNLAYARALQAEEVKSTRTAHRAGRGAQTGEAPEGMSTAGVRGMTLGDDDEQKKDFALPELPARQAKTPATLQQATTASGKIDSDKDTGWQYRISSSEQLQQENLHVDASHYFWKRLYEQEEGFPAPVEQPHSMPGVKPW